MKVELDYSEIGKRIAYRRKYLGMTQMEVEKKEEQGF